MNELIKIFNGNKVRSFLDENDKPYFCAMDITNILGYSNGRDAVIRHCKSDGVVKRDSIDSLNRQQFISYINEGNLYRLIIKSEKPEAEQFEKWIFETLLPELRKTGEFKIKSTLPQLPQTFAQALRLAADLQEQVEKQTLELEIKTPKAEVYDQISDATNYKSVGEVAKIIGTGRNKLFDFMRDKKILMANNLPYQNFINSGYFVVKTNVIKDLNKDNSQVYFTSKGELWIAKLFKE